MVMVKCSKGKERFYLSQHLHDLCMRIKDKMHIEDSMGMGILWGNCGCGKSVLAQQLALTVDPSFEGRVLAVGFDKKEFINAILNSKKQSVIGDEGIALFNRRGVMTKEGREMGALMDQIRQKNLFIVICVPKLTTIDKNIIEEANFVGYVWESRKKKDNKRFTVKGNVAIYPKLNGDNYIDRIVRYLEKKKAGRKTFMPPPAFTQEGNPCGDGYKQPWYPVGKTAYLKKKNSILDAYKPQTNASNEKRKLILQIKKNCPEFTDEMIGKAVGLSREWVNKLSRKEVNS